MSIAALNWAWRQELPPMEKLALVAIADFADGTGSCFPGQGRLVDMTGMSQATLKRAIAAMEAAGLLSRERRTDKRGHRTSDRYQLHMTAEDERLGLTLPNRHSAYKAESPLGTVTAPRAHSDHSSPYIGTVSEPSEDARPVNTKMNTSVSTDDDFEQWWQGYPRKENKGRARTAFKTALKKATVKQLTDGRDAYAARINAERTETKYIAHASSWLNGERWADETPAPSNAATPHRITGRMDF